MQMERRIINPWSWQDQFGFVQATEVVGGQRALYCAGQTSVDAQGRPVHAGNWSGQISTCFDNLESVLGEAGYRLADVVRLNYYTQDTDQLFAHWGEVASRLERGRCRPCSTLLGVSRLAFPELLLEIEATAVK